MPFFASSVLESRPFHVKQGGSEQRLLRDFTSVSEAAGMGCGKRAVCAVGMVLLARFAGENFGRASREHRSVPGVKALRVVDLGRMGYERTAVRMTEAARVAMGSGQRPGVDWRNGSTPCFARFSSPFLEDLAAGSDA